ncbi:MAG: hypothetical protein QGG40_12490, partial [Myxococcota bacterium]|nr:hypothetical protein [Myxococcota bacterium]
MVALLLGVSGGWTDESSFDATFLGESEYARVGTRVRGAGDVDGDGLDDLLLSGELNKLSGSSESYDAGRAYLVLGRESGWAQDTSLADAESA